MKKSKLTIFAMLLALSLLVSCGITQKQATDLSVPVTNAAPSTGNPETRQDFVFGVYNFSKLDPADSYNGWGTIRYGVGETLFNLNEHLEVVPVLVTEFMLSEDNLTWTLQLRDDVTFHNGKPMDGWAVKASLERLVAKNERAAADLKLAAITADGFSVAISTTQPNPTLLNSLCDPYACIIDAAADDGSVDFNLYPVGTGPYVVKSYVEDVSATLEPCADYWGGTPASKSVTVKAISDVDTLALAMQNGEIDAAYGLSYDTLNLFGNDEQFTVSQAATTRVYMLFFNLEHEFMADETFRRAVCMAVDKDSYGSVLLNGAGTPTQSAFPAALSYGDDSKMTDVPDYDPEGARILLAGNGYKDTDGDGFLEKDGKKVTLRLVTYGRTGLPQTTQALQSALQDIGIAATYEQFESIDAVLAAGDFDICAYAYVTTPTGDPLSFLSFTTGTGNGANYGRYSNPQVDQLLHELSLEFDRDKRAARATEIQQIVTGDCAYSYLFHLNMFMVTKKGVRGIQQSPVDYYQITARTARE
ncbi:MAG: ABC transporter substrate-binding protein [Eubacteriales bacterium]|nr:ABC transporter substrate-binding protein [Eubacteriales bacterium]